MRAIKVLCLRVGLFGPVGSAYIVRFQENGLGEGSFVEDGLTIIADTSVVLDGIEGEIRGSAGVDSGCRDGIILEEGGGNSPKDSIVAIIYGEVEDFYRGKCSSGFHVSVWSRKTKENKLVKMFAITALLCPGDLVTICMRSNFVIYIRNRSGGLSALASVPTISEPG